jgi:hypothetical protein
MKKHYKVKEKNITKLKSYLKDGIKRISKGIGRSFNNKHDSIKRGDIQ